MKLHDLTGMRFGSLTVLEFAGMIFPRASTWKCKCDCGKEVITRGGSLKRGTQSCGCLSKAKASARLTTHGRTETREHNAWMAMKDRCYCTGSSAYSKYGAKGISVCERWRNSFPLFFQDMGICPPGMSLDRWPNQNGNYEPDNCRWATCEQQANNRRSNVMVEFDGQTKNIKAWSQSSGIEYSLLRWRIKSGWPMALALSLQPKPGRNSAPW